ncbi:MAG: Flagellar hook-associated protein 1 [Bacteroidota bacterium]|nr:Flagellar hook-associated protein 1 [Bacteroidota bacterium]
MSTFGALEIGKRALIAQKFGLDVTSNNIANVNTPGYSRRTPVFSEETPISSQAGFLGTGVIVNKLRTFREDFFDAEIRSTTSRQAGYEADQAILQKVDTILAEPSDLDISKLVTDFFNAFEQSSLKPEDIAMRERLLGLGQTLVDRFHSLDEKFKETRAETGNEINSLVNQSNQLIKEITELNKSISMSKSETGVSAQTLVDQRELKLEELSKISFVTVGNNDNGSVNVFMNGINIITDATSYQLKAIESVDSSTGERNLELNRISADNTNKTKITPVSGELDRDLYHYNVTLDDKESSGQFSVIQKLNDFANAIVTKINPISIQGYGLDDVSGTAPGRTFFEPAVGGANAATIELSSDIKGKARDIPFSSKPGEPGNNEIALKISRLNNDPYFLDNLNPTEFYATFIGKIGSMEQEANTAQSTTRMVAEQLETQRESTIGVNLDEEAVNIIKFQKAFEASTRIVNTMSDIIDQIINLGR